MFLMLNKKIYVIFFNLYLLLKLMRQTYFHVELKKNKCSESADFCSERTDFCSERKFLNSFFRMIEC